MIDPIHPATAIGPVYITISDLERSLGFYQNQLGLQLINREFDEAYLGVVDRVLVVLKEDPAAHTAPNTTGLYHFALRVPSRLELAKSLQRLSGTRTYVQGFADHLVSEAVYLSDPDDIGIEIYRDRPRDQWQYINGQLKMATDPLDLDGVLGELAGQVEDSMGMHPETTMGHIHLRVAQISPAENFYRDVIGFDLTLQYGPMASFLSAGGYHHHIGINTWAGVGLPPPRAHTTGLRWFTVQFHSNPELDRAVERAHAAGVRLEKHDDGWLVRDPSSNGVLLAAKNDST
jgi:catechol 2,3-dioxygenase